MKLFKLRRKLNLTCLEMHNIHYMSCTLIECTDNNCRLFRFAELYVFVYMLAWPGCTDISVI